MAEGSAAPTAADVELLLGAAAEAGAIAMRYFGASMRSWMKPGQSPVTQADVEIDEFLRETLLAARPDYGWLSEETAAADQRLGREIMFVVDPLDGTRGFLAGDRRWCLSLAIVAGGRPGAAVLHCPALERTFSATAGGGARLNGRPIDNPPSDQVRRVTGSRRINAEIAERLPGRVEVLDFVPSLAYRLALVASGEIDGAFARPGAHDWDVAAADLILTEAGGCLLTLAGQPVRYTASGHRMPSLLAAGPGRRAAMFALARDGGFLQ
ncbi:MAG: 3'(2'),5'-bisphosphate nucleotidase CysQ [Alphaproteobacteria bacterium]|nr:MAG: 3'(2'),5'-bisphosphate nucleotidase CysQ [Alphaproteobacteria bacterium]